METWFLIALIAPALWSIVNLIDVYLVDSVYENEFEATIIIGTLQLLPWLSIPLGWHSFALPERFWFLILAGFSFTFSMVFLYFRFLFKKNDVALLQILLNVSVPVTAFLSWLIFHESLSIEKYVGMGLIVAGCTLLTLFDKALHWDVKGTAGIIMLAVVFLSAYFLLSKYGYSESSGNFFDGYLAFSLGGFLLAPLFLFWKRGDVINLYHRVKTKKLKYLLVFLLPELIVLSGNLTSQRALDLSPSASYVATLESLMPLFVLLFSLILFGVSLLIPGGFTQKELYREQLTGGKQKLFAAFLTILGIYLIG